MIHGHIDHLEKELKNPFSKKTLISLYREKEKRKNELMKNEGIDHFIEMWECQLEKMKSDKNFQLFCKEHNICSHGPIQPRNALQGGRCNAFKLHHKIGKGEKIRYYDIVSLYPFCCITKAYYVGTPTIVKHSFPENCLTTWNGLVKCQ